MSIKLIAAAGIVLLVVIVGISTALVGTRQDSQPTEERTTVSTSTSTMPAEQAPKSSSSTSTKKTTTTSKNPSQAASSTGASYEEFSEAVFRAASSKPRILFFYDSTHAPSVALDSQLRTRASELPHDLHIYRITLATHKDIAEQFGVTQPGTVLKFDSNSQLAGIYIAPDNPTFDSLITTLALKH